MNSPPKPATAASRRMHPMFVELFMSPADDDPPGYRERRRARRARRVGGRTQGAGTRQGGVHR